MHEVDDFSIVTSDVRSQRTALRGNHQAKPGHSTWHWLNLHLLLLLCTNCPLLDLGGDFRVAIFRAAHSNFLSSPHALDFVRLESIMISIYNHSG